MSEFDSPWKEALDRFLPSFLELLFPAVYSNIDWTRGYEALDKELAQIVPEGELGNRLADKLFRVWRSDGTEAWVLVHIEVKAQSDPQFPKQMFVYNYRIFDCFNRPVASLAVLGDERKNWRPDHFVSELWGCEASLRFPMAKLLDFANDLEGLEANPNPFALVVLAHLQSQATRNELEKRLIWKVRLVKALLNRGLSVVDVRQLFRFIDWLLDLPKQLNEQFKQEIHDYQKENKMPYISSLERDAMEVGREEGREVGREEGRVNELLEMIGLGLRTRFGDSADEILPAIRDVTDLEQLRIIHKAMLTAENVDEFRAALKNNS